MFSSRDYYRTVLPPPEELSASIMCKHKECSGKITDISVAGMGLWFDEESDPHCNVGKSVVLRLKSPHLSAPLSVLSQVVHIRDDAQGQIYGFGFLDWMGLRSALPRQLAVVFNQRGDYRIEPDPNDPIGVIVTGVEVYFEVEAQLRDISVGGMSFRAETLAEFVLRKSRHVNVSFALPTHDTPLSFVARICHRDLAGGHINYGLFFIESETECFADQRETVLDYVTARRKQGLEQPAT